MSVIARKIALFLAIGVAVVLALVGVDYIYGGSRDRGAAAVDVGAAAVQQPGCDIKGNVTRDGGRVYHVPGGRFYASTQIDPANGERWFCSEAEAREAGWRKSQR